MSASTTPQAAAGTAITWAGHDIGYMVDIGYSGISMDTLEVTSHDSSNYFKEFVAGLLDGGEVTITLRFIPGDTTGQKYLWADIKARTERQVIITLPDATTWTFNALATKFGDFTMGDEESVQGSLTLKVTGEPTFSEFDA